MTVLIGDRIAAPYLRFHEAALQAMLPPAITRASVTHGGRQFSVYLYAGSELVASSKGSRTILNGFTQAVHAYREAGNA